MGRANSVSGVEATNEEVHGDVTSPSARTTRARRGRGRGDVGVDHHQNGPQHHRRAAATATIGDDDDDDARPLSKPGPAGLLDPPGALLSRDAATNPPSGPLSSVSRDELVDSLTCPITGKLFVDPVTSPCGHTFSRRGLARWMSQPGRAPSCPTCRAPLYHEIPHDWPVNTTIVDVLERFLGEDLMDARNTEPPMEFPPFSTMSGGDGDGAGSELPLFVLDHMTPGQELTLNVFEERYKLMVRRCLRATRRFGMVGVVERPWEEEEEEDGDGGGDFDDFGNGNGGGNERDRLPGRAPGIVGLVSSAASELVGRRRRRGRSDSPPAGRGGRGGRGGGGRSAGRGGGVVFSDHGVECVITAFQELLDGRVLLRCRATRHIRIVSSREEPNGAGYVVARAVPVVDEDADAGGRAPSPSPSPSSLGAPPRRRAPRFGDDFDAWCLAADRVRRATEGPTRDERDLATLNLRLDRAVATHHVWLAHASGRALAPQVGWRWRADDDDDAGAAAGTAARGVPGDGAGSDSGGSPSAEELRWSWGSWGGVRRRRGAAGVLGGFLRTTLRRATNAASGGGGGHDYMRRSYGGEVENLLASCGARPSRTSHGDLSWWLTRAANPLPPLGAAIEIRPRCLATSSASARFAAIYDGLDESLRTVHAMPARAWRGARPLSSAAVALCFGAALDDGAIEATENGPDDNLISPGDSKRRAAAAGGRRNVRHAFARDARENAARVVRDLLSTSPGPAAARVGGGGSVVVFDLLGLPSAFRGRSPATSMPPVPPGTHGVVGVATPLSASRAARGARRRDDDLDDLENLFSPPPRSAADFDASWRRLLETAGWPGVAWALYLRLAGMRTPEEHDDAIAAIVDALFPDVDADAENDPDARRPDVLPTRGDAAIAARSIGSRAAAMKALGARGRAGGVLGAFSGTSRRRVADVAVATVVWIVAALGRAAVTCLFGLGLGVEVAERRVLATLTRGGVFACACAAAMFYVLWYVPS